MGDRVVKTYLGAGPEVEQILEKRSALRKKQRIEQALEWADIECEKAAGAARQTQFQAVADAVAAALTAAGYHRHKGQWRKRRRDTMKSVIVGESSVLTEWDDSKLPKYEPVLTRAENELNNACDPTVLPKVRKALATNPDHARCWGDLAAQALRQMLDAVKWKSLSLKESVRMRANELRLALAGPSLNAMEALLAERAAICWVYLYLTDMSALNAPVGYGCDKFSRARDHRRNSADRSVTRIDFGTNAAPLTVRPSCRPLIESLRAAY